jgi:hypothetical protein
MARTAGPELVIQAGTATSTRTRGDEKQSFNLIGLFGLGRVALEVFAWDGAGFAPGRPASFEFDGTGWRTGGSVAA